MSSLFIKNGRVIDPVNNIDSVANVLVVDGVIAEVSDKLSADADKVIDAEGCWVMPGFIDLHVHLREPGQVLEQVLWVVLHQFVLCLTLHQLLIMKLW